MTKQEIVKYFKLISDKSEYTADEKLILTDEDGYKYFLSIGNLRCLLGRGGTPCKFFNNNPFTYENIELYISKNIGEHIVVVDFMGAKNAKDEFLVRCHKHNITYKRNWNIIKNGQFCNECGLERYKSNRKHDINELKSIAKEKYDITIISESYINNLEPLAYICHKHKDNGIQYRSWGGIITCRHPCVYCASESIAKLNSKSHDEFISGLTDECKVIVIGKYTRSHGKILVKCKQCGDEFYMRPDHIRDGVGCSKCIQSKGELMIESVLNNGKVAFINQYRFNDCILKKPLPFDFYLPELNVCIEYDGIQHFEPVSVFGGEEEFGRVRVRDKIKDEYCNKNGIKLIRIPYWEFENIENILINELKLTN